MKTGLLTIDFLTLQETNVVQDSTNGPSERTVQVGGIETTCDTATVELLRDNLLGLSDRVVPVQFQYKSSYNGFYRVSSITATTEKWYNGATAVVWQATLLRIGPDNAVDVESRLANIVRANDFSLTGERWHAPAISHRTYFTGSSTGTPMTRVTDTGSITVYRGIPAGVNPRWGVSTGNFPAGRVRFLNSGTELMAPRQLLPTTGWELSNGLVRVRPATAGTTTLLIAHYDGTTWREKAWDIRVAGDSLVPATHFNTVNVVRRNHEATAIRIHATQPSNGQRVIVDIMLRRGSRILEGQIQRTSSGELAFTQDVTDAATDNTSYVVSTGADVDGLKMVVGSARNFDPQSDGGIQRSSTTFLDFFVGAEIPSTDLSTISGGFETGVAGWTPTGCTFTQDGTQFKFGSFSGKMVVTGTPALAYVRAYANPVTVTPGLTYRAMMWARSLNGHGDVSVNIDWQNSGSYVSTSSVTAALLTGVWTPMEIEAVAPVGVNQATYGPTLGSSPPTGETLWVDAVHFRGATVSGDKATDLRNQYIGGMAETTEVVRR